MNPALLSIAAGGFCTLVTHSLIAQVPGSPTVLPGWLTSAGVGGALLLVFWIVLKELPEQRKSREAADARFADTLKEISKNFHDEMARERSASASERALDRETRHAMANALQAVSLTVHELGSDLHKK